MLYLEQEYIISAHTASVHYVLHSWGVIFQVQDLAFIQNGSQMLSCNDFVTRDSTDRNIMAWDFQSGVVLSNQIYQVCSLSSVDHTISCVSCDCIMYQDSCP